MSIFVHLASERDLRSIRRGGIAPSRSAARGGGVFAMPVTRSFYISHQWLRELRRHGRGTIFGVYFRVPDDTPVLVGHYGNPHVEMTAAEAVGLMMTAETRDPVRARERDERARSRRRSSWGPLPTSPEGYEVVIPGGIPKSAITKIKPLPQVVGWRYRPDAHGRPPCSCICCERGTYGIGKLLRQVEAEEEAGREPRAIIFGRPDSSYRRAERLRKERGGEP